MKAITRKVDQWIYVGGDIRISATDIDPTRVRLIANGRVLGGSQDGEKFDAVHELGVGQSCHFGPHVAVMILEIIRNEVRLGVMAPANVEVYVKDQADKR